MIFSSQNRIRRRVEPTTAALNLTIEEAATLLGVGRSTFYAMMGQGRVRTFRIGRSRRVARAEVERLVRELAEGGL
jgi:excisionase family DNA binding protein